MTLEQARAALRDLPTSAPAGRVSLEYLGDVATITLDHDACRNALTTHMMVQFLDIVAALEARPPRVWTLSGTGRAFCAGGHLTDVREFLGSPRLGLAMSLAMADAMRRLNALTSLGIVAVQGAAVGGGAELTLAGDLCFVQNTAQVAFVQAHRGVALGWGGAERLVERVGPQRALQLLLVRVRLSAADMEREGLGIACEDAKASLDQAVRAVLALPQHAVQAVIKQVRQPQNQADSFAEVWGSDAHLASLASLPWGKR